MENELMMIQITQDMEELAEQYEGAASNERLWAKGSPNVETAKMHEETAEHNIEMANMYRRMAKCHVTLLKMFGED